MPSVFRVKHALEPALKRVEVILMRYVNVRLHEPHNKREEELVMVFKDRGLFYMTAHFNPWRRYKGGGCCTWWMQK